jgi:Ni,Fe-hydrogenase III large subunit
VTAGTNRDKVGVNIVGGVKKNIDDLGGRV